MLCTPWQEAQFATVWDPARSASPWKLSWLQAPVHSFVALPRAGEEARIAVTADIHVTNQSALGYQTMMDQIGVTFEYMSTFHPEGWHAWIDLGDLVEAALDRVEPDLRGRRVRVTRRIGASVPILVLEADLVRRVLTGLLAAVGERVPAKGRLKKKISATPTLFKTSA